MLPSYVQIANLALGHIGEDDRISDPDEDGRAARTVKTAWELTRLFVLADVHWSFAARTVAISSRPADSSFPVALNRTAFPLPADLVNLIEIVEPEIYDDHDEFAIEGGLNGMELLVEHDGPIVVRYVRDGADIADPARWSAGFAEAFAFRLAWQISDPLAADKGRKDRALKSYEAALVKARKANGRTKPRKEHHTTPWTRARHGGGTGQYLPTDGTHPR